MVQWTMAAVGIAESFANFTGDTELARQLNFAPSTLRGLPDLDCRERCQALLELVSAAVLRAKLTDYGLTDAILETADDMIDEFSDLIGKPRQLVIQRKGATGQIEAIFVEVRAFLDGVLDSFMRQYGLPVQTPEGLARQALYADYQSARKIVDLGGRGGGDEEPESSSSSGSGGSAPT
jgi:hypothetical protein